MGYELGIDLGTTYTGAAIHRDGRVEMCSLGSRAAAIPSVVLLREDETVLTGEAAVRRALSEPGRVAREFKRRLGDPTPIIVGGSPYSAESLMARLLRNVVDEVSTREGGPPERIAVSHPANWGPYKVDLLHQAVRLADLDPDQVSFISEPAAAATFYAHQERVEPGEIVAVYDLGGGTFDAAVLRAGTGGFEILGRPEGIERLGGIDFDAAVFGHVVRSLGGLFDELDPDDPVTQNAVARLRQECVDAKEALSSDTDAVVPVLLPNIQTEVRITRAEFESIIRPSLADSIASMRRALRAADVEPDDVSKVLLVGGSSRIPLIAQLVSAELGRPVAVDAHPKHAISMGAAYLAAGHTGVGDEPGAGAAAAPPEIVEQTPFVAAPAAALVAESMPTTEAPVHPEDAAPTQEAPATPAATEPVPAPPPAAVPPPTPPIATAAGARAGGANGGGGRSKAPLLVGVGVLAALVVIAAVVLIGNRGDDTSEATATTAAPVTSPAEDDGSADDGNDEPEATTTTEAAEVDPARPPAEITADVEAGIIALALVPGQTEVEVTANDAGVVGLDGLVDDEQIRQQVTGVAQGVNGVTDVQDRLEERPPDERCTEEIRDRERWVCVIEATVDEESGTIRATYVSDFAGDAPNVDGGFHYHVFGADIPVEEGGVPGSGPWVVWDEPELEVPVFSVFNNDPVSDKLCMRIADAGHSIDEDSGNCRPLDPWLG